LIGRLGSVVALLGLQTAPATAAESEGADELVVVLQPANAAPSARRTLLRIGDELAADGYRVVVTDASASVGPGSMLESVRGEPGRTFVIALYGDPSNGQSELWVVARTGRRLAARRATVLAEDPDRMPERPRWSCRSVAKAPRTCGHPICNLQRGRRRRPRPRAAVPDPSPRGPLRSILMWA
jgi:hypothetical protein